MSPGFSSKSIYGYVIVTIFQTFGMIIAHSFICPTDLCFVIIVFNFILSYLFKLDIKQLNNMLNEKTTKGFYVKQKLVNLLLVHREMITYVYRRDVRQVNIIFLLFENIKFGLDFMCCSAIGTLNKWFFLTCFTQIISASFACLLAFYLLITVST